jgi:GNAT superfamily N-acetyltransferase
MRSEYEVGPEADWRVNDSPQIRSYEPRDRKAVREICCDTADADKPVERIFPDREAFADLLTSYYTDLVSSTTWVAERDGEVLGYLTGCLDTRRYLRAMAFRIAPIAFAKALVRGTLWHATTIRLLSANLGDWLRGGFRRGAPLREYPAHVHINLQRSARGAGVGERLMEKFLRQAQDAGIPGVYANVSETNEGGRRFFEKLGFVPLVRESRLRLPEAPDKQTFTIVYGKRLFS